MGFNEDFVIDEIMSNADFEILSQEMVEGNVVLTVVADIHPDDEFKVTLITKDDTGEDTMLLQFDGPDEYTEEEAKIVLQQIMDLLVNIIEKALDEVPTPADLPEDTPPPEQETPEDV